MAIETMALVIAEHNLPLRAFLRERALNDQQIASLLAYELAATIGRRAHNGVQAENLLRHYMSIMAAQIAAFGVGTEHP